MPRILLLSIAVFAVGGRCLAQPLSASEAKSVDAAIRAEMTKQQAVGVAVGVVRRGAVAYVNAYGFADRENRKPATTKTVFNWASNSKPVMAVLAMKLAESGKLDLDADIRKYVPEFPAKSSVITTRHLLCHQSGLPHYSNGHVLGSPDAPADDNASLNPLQAIRRFDRSPLLFEPGTKESYSSFAYVLLTAVVQQAGQRDIQSQLETEIIKPLQLSSFALDLAAEDADWAAGYRQNRQTKQTERTPQYAHSWKHGAGAYKSNIEDFARWAQALLAGELLTGPMQRAMFVRQRLKDGTETEWGLGIQVSQERNSLKLSHGGQQEEATSRLVIYPESGNGVVILTNCEFAVPSRLSTAVFTALSRR